LGKAVVLCLDGHTETSQGALHWAMRHVVRRDDTTLHLVTVLPPKLVSDGYPVDDYFGIGNFALAEGVEAEASKREQAAHKALQLAVEDVEKYKVGNACVTAVLKPEGGASGVGRSVVKYARQSNAAVVIVGSRGYGAFKRGLAALAGLGSVSGHCVAELHCPVVCVKGGVTGDVESECANNTREPSRLCIAMDNTAHSHRMLQWAAEKLVHEQDELHLITVCHATTPDLAVTPTPMMADIYSSVADPEDATQAQVHDLLMREAERAIDKALEILKEKGVSNKRIVTKILEPEGGASEVGKSITQYINRGRFFCAVVGNRCQQNGWARFMSHVLLGHASVSEDCVHNVECPVVVYKSQ